MAENTNEKMYRIVARQAGKIYMDFLAPESKVRNEARALGDYDLQITPQDDTEQEASN
jgi:hypothetical protein